MASDGRLRRFRHPAVCYGNVVWKDRGDSARRSPWPDPRLGTRSVFGDGTASVSQTPVADATASQNDGVAMGL
jgi:hypothetical protein